MGLIILKLKVAKDDVRRTIQSDAAFGEYGEKLSRAFAAWADAQSKTLRGISPKTKPKTFVKDPAEAILAQFAPLDLVDKYDVYEALLSYWNETMADDVYAIVDDGYEAGRECADIVEEKFNKKTKKTAQKVIGWEGRIIPRAILDSVYFGAEVAAIEKQRGSMELAEAALAEYEEEHSGEDDEIDEKEVAKLEKAKKQAAKKLKAFPRRYVNGETHYLWGEQYFLTVESQGVRNWGGISLSGNEMTLVAPEASTVKSRGEYFTEWYRRILGREIAIRLAQWERVTGFHAQDVAIQNMVRSWGTCNPRKGLVRFNLQLVKKPKEALDYVIVHELCHFKCQSHGPMFRRLLDRFMPNWRDVRRRLNATLV